MKQIKPVWIKAIYAGALLAGGFISYKLLELKPAESKEPTIFVTPAQQVVIHDTITTEIVKWRTPVKKVCCCEMSPCNGKEQENQECAERAVTAEERGETPSP